MIFLIWDRKTRITFTPVTTIKFHSHLCICFFIEVTISFFFNFFYCRSGYPMTPFQNYQEISHKNVIIVFRKRYCCLPHLFPWWHLNRRKESQVLLWMNYKIATFRKIQSKFFNGFMFRESFLVMFWICYQNSSIALSKS